VIHQEATPRFGLASLPESEGRIQSESSFRKPP
jgi:hypothetical protein